MFLFAMIKQLRSGNCGRPFQFAQRHGSSDFTQGKLGEVCAVILNATNFVSEERVFSPLVCETLTEEGHVCPKTLSTITL